MKFLADFHLHSKYSRATSKDLDIDHLSFWARKKGVGLLGTGDFTHPLWLKELKSKLKPVAEGIFSHKNTHFILTCEISNIYSKNGKTYRIHSVLLAPSFKTVEKLNKALTARGMNLKSDGRPILGMDVKETFKIALDIDEKCFLIPAHIWTPWFSLFGSKSGFDKIEDCFEELTDKIHALETGLSSDPAMNWRLSALDRFTLVSNSDAHSPQKIGRECNMFNCRLSYDDIIDTLEKKDKKRLLYTVEFYPEEGKYHYDGHALCHVSFSPAESKRHNNICPECKKPLVLGVMHRIDELADRPQGYKPKDFIPYRNLVPLDEIIADAKGMGKTSQAVQREYESIINQFDTEFNVLAQVKEADLKKVLSPQIAQGILRARAGQISILPGYDGEYGKIAIFEAKEEQLSVI